MAINKKLASYLAERKKTDAYWVESAKLDFAYGHIFASDASVDLRATGPGNTFRGNLAGSVQSSSVDYLAVQFANRF